MKFARLMPETPETPVWSLSLGPQPEQLKFGWDRVEDLRLQTVVSLLLDPKMFVLIRQMVVRSPKLN